MVLMLQKVLMMVLMLQKRKKISTDAKIMIAIKVIAYGSCINSFHDYHQLGHWH